MFLPPVIAFCGPQGAGKSTIARAMGGLKVIGFADPLRRMMAALYEHAGLPPAEINERLYHGLKESADPVLGGRSPRYAMRTLGTEWGRTFMGPEFWLDIWCAAADAHQKGPGTQKTRATVIVDDLRFVNEAREVRRRRGVVIELRRKGAAYDESHPSGCRLPDEWIDRGYCNDDVKPAVLALKIMNDLRAR